MNDLEMRRRRPRELLVVDVRGMKSALVARAAERGVSVSDLVRSALNSALTDAAPDARAAVTLRHAGHRKRIGLRLRTEDARELATRAKAAGLSLGNYLLALMREGKEPPSAADRTARVAALIRSNAELVVLSRSVAHLAALLRQGSVRAAQEYQQTLDELDADVRGHLAIVASVLHEVRRPGGRHQPTESRP